MTERQFDLLIFDLDGTLVDTAPDIMASANHVLRSTGYPERDLSGVKHAIGRGVHELLNQLSSGSDRPPLEGEALERACALYREHYVDNLVVDSREYPGVTDTLLGPLGGLRKAIVTNKPHALTGRLLKEVGFEGIFDPVIGTGWKHAAKPSGEGILAAMAHHGVPPDRTILIGDSEIDRQAAANAGVRFGWVSYGYDTVARDEVFCVFDDPRQWEELNHGNV